MAEPHSPRLLAPREHPSGTHVGNDPLQDPPAAVVIAAEAGDEVGRQDKPAVDVMVLVAAIDETLRGGRASGSDKGGAKLAAIDIADDVAR